MHVQGMIGNMKVDFDEYVSLGYNCEVGLQIRRVLGRDESSFFSWGIFHIDSLIRLIETRFEDVFGVGALDWDEVHQLPRETKYDFAFHGPWRPGKPSDDPNFAEELLQYRLKAAYLRDKFLRPSGRRLYLYKPICTQPTEKVNRLAELLAKISPDATIVLLRLSYETSSNATHPMIVERTLEHAAPGNMAEDGHVPSWDHVFAEFPHRELARDHSAVFWKT